MWAALRGSRTLTFVAVIGVGAVYLVPTAFIGPPQYPAGGWRSGLLFAVLSTVIAFTIIRLVEQLGDLLARFEDLARSDELTGLPNRRAWSELFDRELATARRSGAPLWLGLLDLDSFKEYNDAHGHLAGDELLRDVVAAWTSRLREVDVLARWGGDEFGLLLPGCGPGEAQQIIDRIRSACPPGVSFSAGLASVDPALAPDEIFAEADRALYDEKCRRRRIESAETVPAAPGFVRTGVGVR